MTTKKTIIRLKNCIEQIENIKQKPRLGPDFKKWQRDTEVSIEKMFGRDTRHIKDFQGVEYSHRQMSGKTDQIKFIGGLDDAKAILESFITEVEEYGIDITDALTPKNDYSASTVAHILQRFRECCQYEPEPPKEENRVQEILWIMLRAHFDRLEREKMLPKFGIKNYKPDFGIPALGLLIEVKYIGTKTKSADIQESILADVPGYLAEHSEYDSIIVFIYDGAHKLRDPQKFIEDLTSVDGIINTIVIPGMG